MRVVMTLLVRDEADVIDAQIAFHLNAGVDFVVATDHRSEDGTTEILGSYAREGVLHLIRRSDEEIRQSEWVTHMARLAATDFGADWVLNADADEFWWPRGGTLPEILAAVPGRYGIVRGLLRNFVPRPDDGSFFAERMTVRLSAQAPINDPTGPYRPYAKVAHRADPDVVVGGGNHDLVGSPLLPLRGWCPIEILHFPLRSLAQCERKYLATWTAWERSPEREPRHEVTKAYEAHREGRLGDYYDSLTVGEGALASGLGDGSLAVDERLRDALRALRAPAGRAHSFLLPAAGEPGLEFARPGVVDDAAYAVDVAVLGEADTVRLQRRVDGLEQRLAALEAALPARISRRVSHLANTVLGRG